MDTEMLCTCSYSQSVKPKDSVELKADIDGIASP